MANVLRLTREQLAIITGGDPRAIKAFEDFFATLNNLGAHAPTHEPGGSDPLTVDAIPAIGSLRTLGTGAQKAAAGIHAATHVTGGGDTIADAVSGGNSGLLSGADKTKLDGLAPVVDTAANLAASNPVLASGQLGYETDTKFFKIGDGSTAYNSLTYAKPDATKAPLPQTAAGVGQDGITINSGLGTASILPAGGTWDWLLIQITAATGGVAAGLMTAGISAGGTTVGAATAGIIWIGKAWRIA